MRLKAQKPDCPQKPPDLAQRVKSLMALADDELGGFTSGRKTDVSKSMCFLASPESPSQTGESTITSKYLSRSFDDLDIPYIDEDEDQTSG